MAFSSIRHLYVHIPFCPHICPYCSFHVLRADKELSHILVTRLIEEHRSIHDDLDLQTVFFGGGTPTALSTAQLERVASEILGKSNPAEVTAECNPSTLSLQKAKSMWAHGINRLSIGAQSMDPKVLQKLGRTHSVRAVRECVEIGRSAGFENINIDLIFGVPGQTLASWEKTLETVLSLNPSHLSCYGLTYEEDTDFFARLQRGECQSDQELELEMFRLANRILTQAGFHHYEISNYARPGFESLHNLSYWRGEEFHGIGPSAVSTVQGVRRTNGKLTPQGWNVKSEEPLSAQILASERMALGLRTSEGVEEEAFRKRFGFSPEEKWRQEIDLLVGNSLLTKNPFKLSAHGLELADEIAAYFVG